MTGSPRRPRVTFQEDSWQTPAGNGTNRRGDDSILNSVDTRFGGDDTPYASSPNPVNTPAPNSSADAAARRRLFTQTPRPRSLAESRAILMMRAEANRQLLRSSQMARTKASHKKVEDASKDLLNEQKNLLNEQKKYRDECQQRHDEAASLDAVATNEAVEYGRATQDFLLSELNEGTDITDLMEMMLQVQEDANGADTNDSKFCVRFDVLCNSNTYLKFILFY
jgi:hypothetical protein